jgi:hypothetical protein
LVDTQALLMQASPMLLTFRMATAACCWWEPYSGCIRSLKLYSDSSYAGAKFQARCGLPAVGSTWRSSTWRSSKFVVLPKRWIVERMIGWLNRCPRLAKDWECLNQNARAFLR